MNFHDQQIALLLKITTSRNDKLSRSNPSILNRILIKRTHHSKVKAQHVFNKEMGIFASPGYKSEKICESHVLIQKNSTIN